MQEHTRYVVTSEWNDDVTEYPYTVGGFEVVGYYVEVQYALLAAIKEFQRYFNDYYKKGWFRVDVHSAEFFNEAYENQCDTDGDVLHLDTGQFVKED